MYEFHFHAPDAAETLRPAQRFVIDTHERGVLLCDGEVLAVLDPGAHRVWGLHHVLRRVDVRPFVHVVPVQEVPTADGVTVKLTVAVQARIDDPVRYLFADRMPLATLYLAVQVAFREAVAAASVDDLVAARTRVADDLRVRVGTTTELGLHVDRLEIKDIILPAELRRAQGAILLARAEGHAALERARGEAAALRSLVNTARLAADNPALLQLRLIQELGGTTGHTVVLGSAAVGIGER